MSTRAIVSFVPTKDMWVTFNPEKLPKENPLGMFFYGDMAEAIKNIQEKTKPVYFMAGDTYSIYCHHEGCPEGVGQVLAELFSDEESVANLIAAGDCSAIMKFVLPYTAQGENFEEPVSKPLGSWCAKTDVSFVFRWREGTGWEVAPKSEFRKKEDERVFVSLSE